MSSILKHLCVLSVFLYSFSRADGQAGVNSRTDGRAKVNSHADGQARVTSRADGQAGVNFHADGQGGMNSHADGRAGVNSSANAQGDTVHAFTLDQCVEYALKHQPRLNQALIGVDIARVTNSINLAGWLP